MNIMKTTIAICLTASILAGCATSLETRPLDSVNGMAETTSDGTSTAATLHGYKTDIAQRISQVNSTKVYVGRPQPLLRSVIVVKFHVDGNGQLLRSDILRTNHDHVSEATALATLRNTAPFPKPAAHLLRQGRVEILESWLFNNDGRFQLRTIAMPQMDE
jgi:protein TonB